MKVWNFINNKFEGYALVTLLVLIVLLVNLQVFSRYVVPLPVSWSSELSRYLFVWISWLSVSYAIHQDAHIKVEMFKNKFKGVAKKFIEIFELLVFFIFALFLIVLGFNFITMMGKTNQQSPTLDVPMWVVYLVVPLSGALMCLRLVQRIIIIFRE